MSGKVRADISVSLDGFITGPNDGIGNGLGDGGERLHEWIFGLKSWREPHGLEGGESNADDEVMAEAFANTGAIVIGRRMFDIAEEPWGEEPPFHLPVFVVTHRPREPLEKKGGTTFHFVDGIDAAHEGARSEAGGKDVSVAGGASVIQQSLNAGLLDEIQIHLVPIFLGDGVRLFDGMDPVRFELAPERVVDSPAVTHLKYRIAR